MALTAQRKRLIEEYLVDCNAVQAALRAGYSKSFARTQTHLVLKEPEVAAALQEAMDARSEKIGRRNEDVTRDLETIVKESMADGDRRNALKGIELEMRHRKMLSDKLELSGSLRHTHEQALAELE